MQNYCDDSILTITIALDKNGQLLSMNENLPLNEDVIIPNNLVQLNVYEIQNKNGQEYRYPLFSIHVGNTTTIKKLCRGKVGFQFFRNVFKNCPTIDTPLCYHLNDQGKRVVTGIVFRNDIVVANIDELKQLLMTFPEESIHSNRNNNKVHILQHKK